MQRPRQMTAIIEREGDGFVALCPSWTSLAKVPQSKRRAQTLSKP